MEQYIKEFVYEEDKEMLRQASSLKVLKKELAKRKQHYVNYRIYRNSEIMYYQSRLRYSLRSMPVPDPSGVSHFLFPAVSARYSLIRISGKSALHFLQKA